MVCGPYRCAVRSDRVEEEFAAQPVKGNGGLDGVQILALDVLDEGDFEQTVVGISRITTARTDCQPAWRHASGAHRRPTGSVHQTGDYQRLNDAVGAMDCASSDRRSLWNMRRGCSGLG